VKLSLSGRLFESAQGYRLNRDEFLAFAKQAGYEGVELRYPQMPMESPVDEVAKVKQQLAQHGLTWVFGTVEGIHEPALFERSLTTMKQHKAGGAHFTRCTAFKSEQIPLAQRFADEAAKMGVTLLMQVHANTITDNVEHALDAMKKLDRPNVKLAYDANHLLFDGDSRYVDAIANLRPYIATMSVQNYKFAPDNTPAADRIKIGSRDYVRAMPGDPAGIDYPAVFRELKRVGFDGWVTVMCDCPPGMDNKDLAQRWHDYLRPLC
jgi:sugar phosphate isomerase/epimerase